MVDTYYGHTSNDNVKTHSKNPTIESFSDKGYISSQKIDLQEAYQLEKFKQKNINIQNERLAQISRNSQ